MTKFLQVMVTLMIGGLFAACQPQSETEGASASEEEVARPVVAGEETGPEAGSGQNESNGELTWMVDFHKALAEAREKERPVLINITGSDWCPPCIFLKENVFHADKFIDYAGRNLVLLEVDFPRERELSEAHREQNEAIADLYRAEVFPTLILADANAQPLKRMEGAEAQTPDAFIRWLEE